ncbi:glycosyltransferase [Pseudochryseolinea flava]|uniref:Glycosyltransferase n=1 Tax=Pseudochryseolinea flava TaxID=2059302 RepID=A0A364Y332_9BACT|nr:glycosyltransferase [Pseudochryseolinea flava]RAW01295.1 glycosyltransferase [Pseudochryseolinea flava]
MRKVMYVIDSLQTGGAEKSVLDIASRLKAFEPVVCHIYKNDFLKQDFEKSGIRVISLNIDGPYNFIKGYSALKKVLKDERPDLVVASLLRSELISRLACRVLRIPNVGTFVNDTYSKYEWEALSFSMKIKIGFFWVLNMLTAKLCVGFLSNSTSIKDSNCKALFVPKNKVAVIYRGRRTDIFEYIPRAHTTPTTFLAVGRLLYRKGFEELIAAFHGFQANHPDVKLTIAGEGPHRKRLAQLISHYKLEKSVTLPGNMKDIHKVMASHDAFVFPSHYEGFSGTLVEAMLSGIPLLASDISMNKEAVVHQSTGWLFKTKDETAIRNSLEWMMSNYATSKAYAEKARAVAEKRFDIDLIAEQHDNYYQEIVNKTS